MINYSWGRRNITLAKSLPSKKRIKFLDSIKPLMKAYLFLFLTIGLLCTSCNGQTKTKPENGNLFVHPVIPNNRPLLIKTQGSKEGDNIHCSLQDRAGHLWFGTTGEGVYRYDGKIFIQFTKQEGLNSNCVYSILEDKEGNIWFGTDNGVCRYNGKEITDMPFTSMRNFNTYTTISSDNNSYENTVSAMLQDKNGIIWFGSTDGLYCYNGSSFRRLLDDAKIINQQNLTLKWVQCMLEDSSGTIWMGSGPIAMEGVIRFDGKSLTSVKPNGDGWIRTMLLDNKQRIWFSGRSYGNFMYDGKNFNANLVKAGSGSALFLDTSGNVWFGGGEKLSSVENEGGIWCYDGNVYKNYNLKDGISKYSVWSMVQDREGNIWIGTRNTGLYKFDGTSFTMYSD